MDKVNKDKESVKFIVTEQAPKRPGVAFLGKFRFDPRLTGEAKILLGEIIALSNEDGHCYVSNEEFSKMFNEPISAIQSHIEELEKFGYLSSDQL